MNMLKHMHMYMRAHKCAHIYTTHQRRKPKKKEEYKDTEKKALVKT